jgi:hypothetical protein
MRGGIGRRGGRFRLVASWTAVTALAFGVIPKTPGALPLARPVQAGGLFESDAPLEVRIEVDLKALVNDRDSSEAEDHPAILTYRLGDTPPVSVDVKVRTRGHWRRQRAHCDFPPLRLNFPVSKVGQTIFANQDKLKLTTPCQPRSRTYVEYILREFLVYKVYNLLTPMSLRARLVRVTYVDAAGRRDSLTTNAFLIEDQERMATRHRGELLEVLAAQFADMDSLQLGLMGVFLYMIGDTDWSLSALHNIGMVRLADGSVHPFAYDFDFAGIVNTEYAQPDPRLPIKFVRQRLYRGPCLTPEQWEAVLAAFRERRAAIYALYDSLPDLPPRYIKDTRGYLDDFYEVIDDPGKLSKQLVRRCWPTEGI